MRLRRTETEPSSYLFVFLKLKFSYTKFPPSEFRLKWTDYIYSGAITRYTPRGPITFASKLPLIFDLEPPPAVDLLALTPASGDLDRLCHYDLEGFHFQPNIIGNQNYMYLFGFFILKKKFSNMFLWMNFFIGAQKI